MASEPSSNLTAQDTGFSVSETEATAQLASPFFKPRVTTRGAKACFWCAREGAAFGAVVEVDLLALIAQNPVSRGNVKFASAFVEERDNFGFGRCKASMQMFLHVLGRVFTFVCYDQILVSHLFGKSHEPEIIVENVVCEFVDFVGKNLADVIRGAHGDFFPLRFQSDTTWPLNGEASTNSVII